MPEIALTNIFFRITQTNAEWVWGKVSVGSAAELQPLILQSLHLKELSRKILF